MNTRPIKQRGDCTDAQKKFLLALESPEALEQPRSERWRWCADQAGYKKDVSISSIVAPIQHLIKEVTESILLRASVEAAWTLTDAASGGIIDAQTKDRIAASKDILDRSVPKKDTDNKNAAAPVALLILPAKQETIKLVEAKELDAIPSIKTD